VIRRQLPRSRRRSVSAADLVASRRAGVVVLVVAGLSAFVWAAGGAAALIFHHRWREVRLSASPGVLLRLLDHPGAPRRAWPADVRPALPSAFGFWMVTAILLAVIVFGSWGAIRLARRNGRTRFRRPSETDWAVPRHLTPLLVRRPGDGRVVIGTCGRRLVATERGHSLLVIGPTQSGKTTGIAIPAIVEWPGPIVATSVKTDLVRATASDRSAGVVSVFDPARVTGLRSSQWSPLSEASTWLGAKRVAAGLCSVQRDSGRSPEDAAFWGMLAEKLLAPMLLAAASLGASMREVVSWVDTGEARLVLEALEACDAREAVTSAQASFSREERQLASVYATAEAAIGCFADLSSDGEVGESIDVARFLDGGAHSMYLVAPSHEQERLRPVFVALLRCLLDEAFTRASRTGPLDPPLLVVLDEAANIAPPSNLDTLASTAASHGVQLVTVWQDFAQIEARYGTRAATVINNHRAKVFCSGITDRTTLEQVSTLAGETQAAVESVTLDGTGPASWTIGERDRQLASAAAIRTLAPGEAVLLYGHLPAARIALRSGPMRRFQPP
jgi:type IV secretion system protein VirD4